MIDAPVATLPPLVSGALSDCTPGAEIAIGLGAQDLTDDNRQTSGQ
jgi:hypothetical protein